MDTPRSRATSGRMPMMTNSVVPIAKAASANARIGGGKRLALVLADSGDDATVDAQGRAICRGRQGARHIGDQTGELQVHLGELVTPRVFARRESRHATEDAREMALVAKSELGGQVRHLLVALRELHACPLDAPSHHIRHRTATGAQPEHSGEVKPAYARNASEGAEREAFAEVVFDVGDDAGHGAPIQSAMRRIVVRDANAAVLIGQEASPVIDATGGFKLSLQCVTLMSRARGLVSTAISARAYLRVAR